MVISSALRGGKVFGCEQFISFYLYFEDVSDPFLQVFKWDESTLFLF